jgi:hypothetical protein
VTHGKQKKFLFLNLYSFWQTYYETRKLTINEKLINFFLITLISMGCQTSFT